MGCDISNGSICGGVTGGIDGLHAPKIVEQDGSEFTKSFTKGETRTLKILNYNPSLKYTIRHVFTNGKVEVARMNHHVVNVPYINQRATYEKIFQADADSFAIYNITDGRGDFFYRNGDKISWCSYCTDVNSISVRPGNYVRFYFSVVTYSNSHPTTASRAFTVVFYKDVNIDETLQVNSDGTFTYTAPNVNCNPVLSIDYQKFYLKSSKTDYTLQVT